MPIAVRPLRADEGRIYLEIVNSAIRGLAVSHYPPDVIDGWVVAVTDETVRDLMLNSDHEMAPGAGPFWQLIAFRRTPQNQRPANSSVATESYSETCLLGSR